MTELRRSEAGTAGVRRIARNQIGKALDALEGNNLSDEAVHKARKELKKARATLRLLRGALGDSTYKRENIILRDAARPLSEARDAKVLLDTLDALAERYGAPAKTLPVEGLRRMLRRERTASRRQVLNNSAVLSAPREAIRSVHLRANRWRVGEGEWQSLGPGVRRVYAKGRKAFAAAERDRSPEKLHEWRKQVKYLWHQLQLLEPLWPGPIGELADQAHKLADYLGDDHDLSVLRDKLAQHPHALPNASARSALVALIDRSRTELRDKAVVLGHRIYEEKPKAFEARFGHYWRDWRREPSRSLMA